MKRDPFLHWLLAFATFGQYAIVWTFLIARDVNDLRGTRRLNVPVHASACTVAYAGYFLGLLLAIGVSVRAPQQTNYLYGCVLLLAFGLIAYVAWLLAFLSRELRDLNRSDSPDTFIVLLLSVLCAGGFPLLQKHLNTAIQTKEDERIQARRLARAR
jgi:hypothetical protein